MRRKNREVQIWQLRDLHGRQLGLCVVRNLSQYRDAKILCRLPRETKWYMRGAEGHVPGVHPVHHEGHQGWTARTPAAAQFHVQRATTRAAGTTGADATSTSATSHRDTLGARWSLEHFR